MAGYLPPGTPFLPPPPPHSTRSRQLSQAPFWMLSPTPTSGNNTTSPGAMVGIAIGVIAFLLVVIYLCRRLNNGDDANAAAPAAAPAAALAVRPRAPPQADYWAGDDEQWLRRHRNDRDDGGATQCASPTAAVGLPSFTYNRGVRHNVTGSGDEAATCSVCLSAFKDGETVRLLPVCLHLYHVECIDPWLEAHSTCPICRSSGSDELTVHGHGGILRPV